MTNGTRALLILQFHGNLIDSLPNSESADVNGDGRINSLDALLFLQFDAGLLDSLTRQEVLASPRSRNP